MPLLAPGQSRMLRSHKAIPTTHGGQIAASLGNAPHRDQRWVVAARDPAAEGWRYFVLTGSCKADYAAAHPATSGTRPRLTLE